MKKGDIFAWNYIEEFINKQGKRDIYHCKSRICIFNGIRLFDTYWGQSGGGGDNVTIDTKKGIYDLHFIANFSELKKINEDSEFKYDPKDIISLNHANSTTGNMYVKNTAKISVLHLIKDCEREIESLKYEIKYHEQQLAQTENILRNYRKGCFELIHSRTGRY